MARLADMLQREKLTAPAWAFDPADPEHNELVKRQTCSFQEEVLSCLREGVIVVADNVAEYFYAGNDQEEWDLNTDYPTLAPPFDRCFIEWRRPSKVVSRECGVRETTGALRATGATCQSRPIAELTDAALKVYAAGLVPISEMRSRLRWWLEVATVGEISAGRYMGPLACFTLLLDEQGRLLGKHTIIYMNWVSPAPQPDFFAEWLAGPLLCLGMVLSFFHCKNVGLREEVPPQALSRAHQKRHGKPLTRYHVLEIEPMKQVLRTEGQRDETGLKKALHICRGHFADYREGQGLFGKYHGRYWVPMHARGAIKEGVVTKDYAVKIPVKKGG